MVTIEKITHLIRDNINNFTKVNKSNMTSIETLKPLLSTSPIDWYKYKDNFDYLLKKDNEKLTTRKEDRININNGYIDANNSYYNNFEFKKVEGDRESWYYRMKLPYTKDSDIFSLYLINWPPYCKSYIHNHEDMGCIFRVLEGEIEETVFNNNEYFIAEKVNTYNDNFKKINKIVKDNFKKVKDNLKQDTNNIGYIDDNIGLHSIQNLTNKDAYSLHLYARRYNRELFKYSHHNFSLIKYFPFV